MGWGWGLFQKYPEFSFESELPRRQRIPRVWNLERIWAGDVVWGRGALQVALVALRQVGGAGRGGGGRERGEKEQDLELSLEQPQCSNRVGRHRKL